MESNQYPTTFGKYELVGKVASGGMAEVFRACVRGEAGFEKFLAIKRILPHLSRDTEFVVMLIDEAKIAVSLNHANVVQVYDLGKVNGQYFIAMEFVEGADLKAVILKALGKGTPIPPALAVFLTMEVLKGLEYAHLKKVKSKDVQFDLQIIHRDISPPNILLSFEGEVKIVDFGIAKANTRMMETSAGVLKGKFEYMSPEQAAGLELDQRTDVFSAGICLYEALTGVNPFSASSDLQVISKVRTARFPPASSLNKDVPPRLDLVLKKALAREKEERYATASEFRNDLAHAAFESRLIATSPKLAAYMRTLFEDNIGQGQHFVSGASMEDLRDNRQDAEKGGPYHRPGAANSSGSFSRPLRKGRENRTILRMKPQEDVPNIQKAKPQLQRPQRSARSLYNPTSKPRPTPRTPDNEVDSTMLSLSDPPQSAPTGMEDFSADATFLAPPRLKKPSTPNKNGESLLGLGRGGHSFNKGASQPRPKTTAEGPKHFSPASTFLPPSPSQQKQRQPVSEDISFLGQEENEPPTLQMETDPNEPDLASKMTGTGSPLYASDLASPLPEAFDLSRDRTQKEPFSPPQLESQTAPLEPKVFTEKLASPLHGASELGEQFSPVYKRPWTLGIGGLVIGFILGIGLAFLFLPTETDPSTSNANGKIGEVLILTEDGATSFVDGQAVGSAYPIRLALPILQTHVLEIKRPGFQPILQEISLEAGATQIIHARFESSSQIDTETNTTENGGDSP